MWREGLFGLCVEFAPYEFLNIHFCKSGFAYVSCVCAVFGFECIAYEVFFFLRS